jgi:hypothetical protein
MQRKIEMTKKRETKGAILFEEVQRDDQENALNTLYVRKVAFKGQVPEKISVTLDW